MVTRRLRADDKQYLRRLGRRIEKIILGELGYKSLDAFALEHHDLIAKPTLSQICKGKRDMKITTLRGLAKALDRALEDLVSELD
jgi:hypothetical protein